MVDDGYISADAWAKGIGYSIAASVVGGASKLAIRKSWLMVKNSRTEVDAYASPETEYDHSDEAASPSSPYKLDEDKGVELNSPLHKRDSKGNLEENEEGEQFIDQDNEQLTMIKDENKKVLSVELVARALRYSGMLGMSVLNPLFCVLAMNYASPSILAPFSGLTLVWIILFSESLISEKPQKKQIIAAALIITGQIIVGAFGDHTNDDGITLQDVVDSYKQLSFQLFFVVQIVFLLVLAYLINYPPSSTLERFAWGVASGVITGFQNFLKDSLSVLKACKATNQALPWYFYVFFCGAAITAFSGLLILTRCMKKYDATFSSSMFVGSFIISASIMADIHYHTFENLNGVINYIMYPTGLGVLMIGLYLSVNDVSGLESSQLHSDASDDQISSNEPNPGVLQLPLVATSDCNETALT